jgi:hypothetical protein
MYKYECKYLYKYGPSEQKMLGDPSITRRWPTYTFLNDLTKRVSLMINPSVEDERFPPPNACYKKPFMIVLEPNYLTTYWVDDNCPLSIDKFWILINVCEYPGQDRARRCQLMGKGLTPNSTMTSPIKISSLLSRSDTSCFDLRNVTECL